MSSGFFAKSLRIFCAEPADCRTPARSRVPAKHISERLGRRRADDAQAGAWGECGVVTCGRRPIGKLPMKKPAADFSARALEDYCDDGAMPVICPTRQILFDAPSVRSSCASTQAAEPAVRGGSPDQPRRLLQRRRTCVRRHLRGRAVARCGPSGPRRRSGAPQSPGTRDRWSCRISDECSRDGADGTQNNGSRQSAERRIADTLPCPGLE